MRKKENSGTQYLEDSEIRESQQSTLENELQQIGRGKGKAKIMCFIGEVIKFQKLLRVQQAKDRKLTLEIDQMELIRDFN